VEIPRIDRTTLSTTNVRALVAGPLLPSPLDSGKLNRGTLFRVRCCGFGRISRRMNRSESVAANLSSAVASLGPNPPDSGYIYMAMFLVIARLLRVRSGPDSGISGFHTCKLLVIGAYGGATVSSLKLPVGCRIHRWLERAGRRRTSQGSP
jgi:hypothetical protein